MAFFFEGEKSRWLCSISRFYQKPPPSPLKKSSVGDHEKSTVRVNAGEMWVQLGVSVVSQPVGLSDLGCTSSKGQDRSSRVQS